MAIISKEFDLLDPEPARRKVNVARTTGEELVQIYPNAAAAFMQHLASLAVCETIRRRHIDNFWTVRTRSTGTMVGIYAMAMLTVDGLRAVLEGRFEAYDPRLTHVAESGAPIAAIYKWGVFTPGIAAAAIPLIAERLAAPDYRNADLFGNGSTPAGQRIMRSVGFEPVAALSGSTLFRYRRIANRQPVIRNQTPSSGP